MVTPKLDKVEIRNWDAYEPAVESGEVAMRDALAKLTKPVAELRRRASLAERAAADALQALKARTPAPEPDSPG